MKWIKYILIIFVLIISLLYVSIRLMVLSPPEVENVDMTRFELVVKDSLKICQDSWLHTNEGGIHELFITGKPYEMGLKNGLLTKELAHAQEEYFFDFIKSLIPSETTLNYLKHFITIFNKDLDEYIPLAYRQEIYGVSRAASDKFDFIGDKYHRMLNYHAAHDIGHTIQNMNLVNCTAFSVQNEYTNNSSLYIGRNLDFSAGDNFARDKLIVFCRPDIGYQFAYISWGGMIGVLSGMNEHGLTVSLNSAKSGIPMSAKTPVSLVSKAVLQNAKNIKEAYEIIASYETFVSESFFIGSAFDNKAVIIEKSLDSTTIFDSNESKLVLTNHFQSDELGNTELNNEAKEEGCTVYRMNRTHELIEQQKDMNHQRVIDILRDRNGVNNTNIGLGNEMAINQLICHHAVVFKPDERIMWVSQFPYQENGFIAYDLRNIFADSFNIQNQTVHVDSLYIKSSGFYRFEGVKSVWRYRDIVDSIKTSISKEEVIELDKELINELISLNENYYYTYFMLGQYYEKLSRPIEALHHYNTSLSCEIPRTVDKQQVLNSIERLNDE